MPRKKSNMKNITSDFYYPVIKKCIYVKYVLNTFIKMRFHGKQPAIKRL